MVRCQPLSILLDLDGSSEKARSLLLLNVCFECYARNFIRNTKLIQKLKREKNAHEYVVIIDEKRQNRKASNKDIYSDTHVTNKQKTTKNGNESTKCVKPLLRSDRNICKLDLNERIKTLCFS